MKSIGIDIGHKTIKIIELEGELKKFEITRAKIYPFKPGADSDPEIAVLQILKDAKNDFDFQGSKIVTNIEQQKLSMRILEFPFVERSKIMKSLPFEMEEEVPFSLGDSFFDGKIISREGGLTKVLGIVCPKKEVIAVLEKLDRVGIDPDIIGSEIFSLGNIYRSEITEVDPQDAVLLRVIIGHKKTHLVFFRNSQIIWSRTILWGAKAIAESIAKVFQVPQAEAENMMPEKAFMLLTPAGAKADQIKMSDAVKKATAPLIAQLKLTMIDFQTSINLPVSGYKVVGPANKIPNLCPHLTTKISVPFSTENILASLPGNAFGSKADHFLLALGLALDGFKRPKSPAINFRQDVLKKKDQGFEKIWQKWGHAAQLLLAAYFVYLAYGITRDSVAYNLTETSDSALVEVAGKVAGLRGKMASLKGTKKYVANQKEIVKNARSYAKVKEISSAMAFLDTLSTTMPRNNKKPKYDVRKFSVKNHMVYIEGAAENTRGVDKIKAALQSLASDKKVKIENPTIKRETGRKIFAFSLKIKRNG